MPKFVYFLYAGATYELIDEDQFLSKLIEYGNLYFEGKDTAELFDNHLSKTVVSQHVFRRVVNGALQPLSNLDSAPEWRVSEWKKGKVLWLSNGMGLFAWRPYHICFVTDKEEPEEMPWDEWI